MIATVYSAIPECVISRRQLGVGTTSPNARLHVIGNVLANGSNWTVVNTAHHGRRKLYAFEQASNRFADEGKAMLVNGVARVNAVS